VSERKSLSPWGELYGQLLRAESIEHRRTPAQHAASTRLRAEDAVRVLTQAHEANQARRERVLRYADLVTRLENVLAISDAARWNGWVPPAMVTGSARLAAPGPDRVRRTGFLNEEPYYVPNTSPVRVALVDICAEAYRRDTEGAQDGE